MPDESNNTSWWDRLIAGLSPTMVPSPPSPVAPTVDETAWAKSVDMARMSKQLTVHQLGLIVFNESQSYTDRSDANEPILMARQTMAHSIINADQIWGPDRPKSAGTAAAIEPSTKALSNSAVRAAYESSMKAAREAYLSGTDPTHGAAHMNARTSASRSNWLPKDIKPPGKVLSTQSGPYNNSYTKGDTPSSLVWLNTYQP